MTNYARKYVITRKKKFCIAILFVIGTALLVLSYKGFIYDIPNTEKQIDAVKMEIDFFQEKTLYYETYSTFAEIMQNQRDLLWEINSSSSLRNRFEEIIQMSKTRQARNQEYGLFFPKPLLLDSQGCNKRIRTCQLDICL